MANDRYGILSKSKVQIWFDDQTFDNMDRNNLIISHEYFFDLSISYLNAFLMNYRKATKEYWIRPLQKSYILGFNYVLLDSEQKHNQASIIHTPIHGNSGEEFSLSDVQETQLRNLCFTNQTNLAYDLYLSAIDNLDLGNYNNTIIDCSILFENFIYTVLENTLSKSKLDKIKKKPECNCHIGIYGVMKKTRG